MPPGDHYQIHLVLGYVPWLLCFSAYVWPGLMSMDDAKPLEGNIARPRPSTAYLFGSA
jgi:hypothetical protein